MRHVKWDQDKPFSDGSWKISLDCLFKVTLKIRIVIFCKRKRHYIIHSHAENAIIRLWHHVDICFQNNIFGIILFHSLFILPFNFQSMQFAGWYFSNITQQSFISKRQRECIGGQRIATELSTLIRQWWWGNGKSDRTVRPNPSFRRS
jgi:hypothetical protein